jgi:hypothetical protein
MSQIFAINANASFFHDTSVGLFVSEIKYMAYLVE